MFTSVQSESGVMHFPLSSMELSTASAPPRVITSTAATEFEQESLNCAWPIGSMESISALELNGLTMPSVYLQ